VAPSLSPHFGERASLHPRLATGVGLRAQHHEEVLERRPAVGWFEAHSENYFAAGSAHRRALRAVRTYYPVSLHGVGLSVGSTDPLNTQHLRALEQLIDEIEPIFVSEHLSWGSAGGLYLNDLLPLPYTEEALSHMVERVWQVQEALGRQILVENISSYLHFVGEEKTEWEFVNELACKSGCALLLDINNIYVNALNHGFDAHAYLRRISPAAVREFHLAGHTVTTVQDKEIRIDTHNARVHPEVWRLYESAVRRFGALPTLIEWDADLPPLQTLQDEATKADQIAEPYRAATP
jgi:uncharacterized protein